MGSKESSSTTESKPPDWAKGLFKQSAADASALYNSGVGGNTYTGNTVSDLSGTTMSGVNQLANAGANTNTAGTRPLYQGIGAASTSPSYSEGNLADMASGKYLREGNPYFNDALRGQLDDTASQVQSQFSGAGRYGSGANTGVLTNQLGNIRSTALRDQFNADSSNMLTANGMMDTARNAGLDRGLQATNALNAQDQQQFQNQLTGAGATLQAGNILDEQAQKQLSDQVANWYAQDNQDWTRLGFLQNAAAGAAGNYGTQATTARQPVSAGGIMGGMASLLGKG
ncbi:MAG: hypothetical protein E5X86_19885 [Mesorhizobium sp.]|uniref:hypothetical protein n=1 Tax=Mesorhizobium sp. TaxID=1871066 RepID=UPI00122928E4|nr:hypothetical protein [Mesorhizobium sp.]TIO15632.1 MAG: hypothetical protein E5X86_19885 [Mesorhizobium sp.]